MRNRELFVVVGGVEQRLAGVASGDGSGTGRARAIGNGSAAGRQKFTPDFVIFFLFGTPSVAAQNQSLDTR